MEEDRRASDSSTEQEDAAPEESARDSFKRSRTTCNVAQLLSQDEVFQDSNVSWRRKVWTALEEPDSHPVGAMCHHLYNGLIILSVASMIAQTEPGLMSHSNGSEEPSATAQTLSIANYVFNSLFSLEVLGRLITAPRFCILFRSMYMWMDIAAVVPFYILLVLNVDPMANPAVEGLQLLVPILRLLKITRHSSGWRILIISVRECMSAMTVPAFLLLLMTVFSSCLLYWLEKTFECKDTPSRECLPGELRAFSSIPHAMWFTVVTIATVGYGDVTPNTTLGKIAAGSLILTGICYMAMPLAIIGGQVTKVWDDRDRILIREKAALRLAEGGIATREHLQRLFLAADEDGSGSVGRPGFTAMVQSFDLGLTVAQIQRIFRSVDADRSGLITFEEFVNWLFPDMEIEEEEQEAVASRQSITVQAPAMTPQDRGTLPMPEDGVSCRVWDPPRRGSRMSLAPCREGPVAHLQSSASMALAQEDRLTRLEGALKGLKAQVAALPDLLREILDEHPGGMAV